MFLFASLPITIATSQAGVATVPFRVADNAIVVDAAINGQKAALMFDSGFGGSVVLDETIDVGAATGSTVLRDFVGELRASTVNLKSLKLGDYQLDPDEKTIVQQPANFSAAYGQHVDGIMGLAALKNKVTEIDFQHRQFVFYPSSTDLSTRVPDNKTTFLVKMLPLGGNAIELPVTSPSGKLMTMALDTGNSFYATTHKDVLERVDLWKESDTPLYIRQSGVASGNVDSWSKKMPPMTIFGVPVQQTVWDVIDLPSSDARGDGTVGFEFLRNFNITFDFAKRRVWLEKWTPAIENEEVGDLGISARYSRLDKAVEVAIVSPGSPAEKAGIKVGDQILSIGSKDLERESYKQLRKLFEGPIGSKVDLAISRAGALKRYHLMRASLTN